MSQPITLSTSEHEQIPAANAPATTTTSHILILLQFTQDDNSRTYLEYEGLMECVEGLCNLYEQRLKVQFPEIDVVKYEVGTQFFEYIDSLHDIAALQFSEDAKAYVPKGREWIKE